MMSFEARSAVLVLCSLMACSAAARGEDNKPYNGPACTRSVDDYFAREVWPKVGSVVCVNCHKEGGDAEGSKLVLRDPQKVGGHARDEAMRHNREAFARLARVKDKDQSRLLVKVTGGLKHGGADVLKPDSKGYLVLAEFVRRLNAPAATVSRPADDRKATPFFDGVVLMEPKRLLRR